MERKGPTLGTVRDSGLLLRDTRHDERRAHDPAIRRLADRFREDTGMHHNDVIYRNVVRSDEDGSLYLIDFEHAHTSRRALGNLDGILR